MRDALATFPDDNSIRLLRDRGIKYVLLHEAFYGRPRYAALTAAADRRSDLKEVFRAGGGAAHARIYRIEAP